MTYKDLIIIINDDLRYHGGKSFSNFFLIILFNMPFRLVLNYRLGCFLVRRRNFIVNILILILKKRQIRNMNCDISYKAVIGKHISFPHPLSIVIGENSIIGNDVMIWQEVTLGSHGKKGVKAEYPIVKNNVKLFSGCKIIGNITIGENSVVASNAVVLNDIEPNKTAVGIPARQILNSK